MNLFRSKILKSNKVLSKKDVLNHPLNKWIKEDRYLDRFFTNIFDKISSFDFERISNQKNIIFLRTNGEFSATLPSNSNLQIILIFPNLEEEIKKVNHCVAEAIIFHEFGHLYFDHTNSSLSDIKKQIEADSFAIKYDYGSALLEFLDNYKNRESHIRQNEIIKYLSVQELKVNN